MLKMADLVEFDDGQLKRLNDVIEKAANEDVNLTFSMGEGARIVKKFSTANFILKGSGRYQPLTPDYAAWKNKNFPGMPILVLTGALKDSVVGNTNDSILSIEKDNFTLGTKVRYAHFIQEGSKKMVARPFLAITEKMVDSIVNTIEDDVANQLWNNINAV